MTARPEEKKVVPVVTKEKKPNVTVYNYDLHDVRIDKNLAYNILEFREFGKDAAILKAIIVYMAVNHQVEDLFGFYKLDPVKFGSLMNYSKSNLFRRHTNPFFVDHHPDSKKLLALEEKHGRNSIHRTWSSLLENALYVLNHHSILNNYQFKDEKKTEITLSRFNFLDEIKFRMEKVGRTEKVVYYYKPNKAFESNLKNYFMLSKINKMNLLKSHSLDDAYIHLLNSISVNTLKGKYTITFNIDTLARILSIGSYANFSKYKAKINDKFNILKDTIAQDIKGLDLSWSRSGNNIEEYTKKVDNKRKSKAVDNLAIISWDKVTELDKSKQNVNVYKSIFLTELNRALIQAYFNRHERKLSFASEEKKKELFYKWIFSEEDMDLKEIKFGDVYMETYKEGRSIKSLTKDFLSNIKRISDYVRNYNCLSYKEDIIYFNMKDQKPRVFRNFLEVYTFFLPADKQ